MLISSILGLPVDRDIIFTDQRSLFVFEKLATMYHSSQFIGESIPEFKEVKPLFKTTELSYQRK